MQIGDLVIDLVTDRPDHLDFHPDLRPDQRQLPIGNGHLLDLDFHHHDLRIPIALQIKKLPDRHDPDMFRKHQRDLDLNVVDLVFGSLFQFVCGRRTKNIEFFKCFDIDGHV